MISLHLPTAFNYRLLNLTLGIGEETSLFGNPPDFLDHLEHVGIFRQ